MPVFHVETTLAILQSLLGKYDSTLQALCQARDAISRIDARQIVNNQRVSEWAKYTLKVLHDTKSSLLAHHQMTHHHQTERDILKSRLERSEREKKTSENLVVSLVGKLNEAEENVIIYNQDIKKLQNKVLSLKTHIQQITKWRDHIKGVGVVNELRSSHGNNSSSEISARERALDYSRRQEAKNRLDQGSKKLLKSAKISTREGRSASRSGPSSRQSSRTRAKSTERQKKEISAGEISAKERLEDQYVQSLFDAVSPALKKSLKAPYQPMYPAQQILLSKLRDVDGEINELARDLMLY